MRKKQKITRKQIEIIFGILCIALLFLGILKIDDDGTISFAGMEQMNNINKEEKRIKLFHSNSTEERFSVMKKVFSALCAFMMSFMLSVTAFAGAPVLFEQPEGIINTGGEGLGLMIGAGVLALLAVGGIIFFFVSGKK